MRTLVTGGAGFVGSHLTEALLDAGYEVRVLDDLSTGRWANLAAVSDRPGLRLVHGSVLDADLVDRLVAGCDTVHHLAAPPGRYPDRALADLRTVVHGTEHVAAAAHRYDARLLHVSTGAVYGRNARIGLREPDDRIVGPEPRWWSADAAAVAEAVVAGYARAGLRAVVVRLFDTAGPRQRDGVVPRFVGQALSGTPLTVHGNGRQVRCFCHVADVVPALATLIDRPIAYGGVFHLGSGEQTTIGRLAERVLELTGSFAPIVRVPAAEDGLSRRVPDCRRARELIGFAPTRGLDEILRDVLADHAPHPVRP
ncbi:NAD-dependent epimerase/dehydratase family protein [Actinocatenispora rupis]|uniref:Epimerase n=1 Tax=Actinocatenispora rupis TaxID=519421 RepID=A0A8J3J9S9_9ACTN|nr:NAD-dependent epimerase/dehydratase family protein [Actinocatenispora rupis]GID10848.1 epimerase [Actinocatenispora rupis]